MAHTEREAEQKGAVLVDAELKHHAATTVRRRQVGLHAAGQAGAVTFLGAARAQLVARDPVALQLRERCSPISRAALVAYARSSAIASGSKITR
jgi:hypothetical protein